MNEIIIGVVGILSTFFGVYFTFLFQKAKYAQDVEKLKIEVVQAKKDAETTEIENDNKVVNMYKSALDDLPIRYEEKYKHVEDMAHAVEKLFEKKEAILMQEIEYHKKQAALYKKMYNAKVLEFNKYKREHP